MSADRASVPSGRLDHVDVAKGISILLVALGHSHLLDNEGAVNRLLGLVRLPLFFFVAGLFLRPERSWGEMLALRSESLLKPFLVTSAAVLVLRAVSGDGFPPVDLLGIVYGTTVTIPWGTHWFLPHLWLAHLTGHGLLKLLKNCSLPWLVAVAVGLFALGAWTMAWWWLTPAPWSLWNGSLPGLPWSLDLLSFTVAWLVLGYALAPWVTRGAARPWLTALALVALAGVVLCTEARLAMNRRQVEFPVGVALGGLAGIVIVLECSRWICRSPALARLLIHCGAQSLFILLFHKFVEGKTWLVLERIGGPPALRGVVAYAASIAAPLAIAVLVRRVRVLAWLYVPAKTDPFRGGRVAQKAGRVEQEGNG